MIPVGVSTANTLLGPFPSIGMTPAIVDKESKQDPTPSSSHVRSDPEDGPDSYHINPSFYDEIKDILDFKVKFSFKHNYKMVIPSTADTIDNLHPGCVAVYPQALEYGL